MRWRRHPACRFAGAVEDAAGVDGEHLLPRVVVGLEHRDAREHARVVDPDVQATQLRDRAVGSRGADGCGIRDVHRRTPTTPAPNRPAMSDAASRASVSSMSAIATAAPASARRSAIAFPSPRAPPVTSARRPVRDSSSPMGDAETSAKGKLTRAPPPGARCAGRPGRARRGWAWGCARTSRGRRRSGRRSGSQWPHSKLSSSDQCR